MQKVIQMTPEEEMKHLFSYENQLQTMLDFEVALASVQASLGLIPHEAAAEIGRVARVENVDMKKLEEINKRVTHPTVAIIRMLQSLCKGNAGQYVHLGVTSQDVRDTAHVMNLKKAYKVIFNSLRRMEENVLRIAEEHANTIMAGRTHFIHALPITFGFKMAVWAREIRRHIQRLQESYERVLVGHVSGAVGTMASFGEKGPEIERLVLEKLGLGVPDICWQASRDRQAEFSNLIAIIAGSIGRLAKEIRFSMSTEVSEVSEPWEYGQVGSSTMPHKRNPKLSERILALTKKIRYNAALVMEVMLVEHERDLNYHLAEVETVSESLIMMGKLLNLAETLVKGMVIYPKNMMRNLDASKGLILSETLMLNLGQKIGKQAGYDIAYEDAMEAITKNVNYKDIVLNDPRVTKHFAKNEIEDMLNPTNYLGLAVKITRNVIKLSRTERENDRMFE